MTTPLASRRTDRLLRALAAFALVSSAALLAAPTAEAVLDQESPFDIGFTQFNERPVAQLFVVGLSGQLESVELFASQLDPTGNLLVSIYEVVDGVLPLPGTAAPLATGSLPLAQMPSSAAGGTGPAFVRVDLDVALPVDAGETLALVVQRDMGGQSGAGGLAWFGNGGLYAEGVAVRFDPGGLVFCTFPSVCEPHVEPPSWLAFGSLGDFAFRTYVPEPAVGAALAAGSLVLAALAARRARPRLRTSGTR